MSWSRRLANLFRSRRAFDEIDEEFAFHLEERIDELVERGMSRGDARRQAFRRFGNPAALRERSWDAVSVVWLEAFWKDLRFATRSLRRRFGLMALLLLVVGVSGVVARAVRRRQVELAIRSALGGAGATSSGLPWAPCCDRPWLASRSGRSVGSSLSS